MVIQINYLKSILAKTTLHIRITEQPGKFSGITDTQIRLFAVQLFAFFGNIFSGTWPKACLTYIEISFSHTRRLWNAL